LLEEYEVVLHEILTYVSLDISAKHTQSYCAVTGCTWSNNIKGITYSLAATSLAADKISCCSRSFVNLGSKYCHSQRTDVIWSRTWGDAVKRC